jgi:serine/threonine protein kinase
MALAAGFRLGPYEILAPIGAGGMGEVYKARDTRLGRDVALKISNEAFSERFEREARSIAALNHPNICHLYDVGPNYLVMELIDGEPLHGPLPLDQALDYARQIADALDAAHEKGIVHRDLKPGNILVTASGVVKVLDFGLAMTAGPPATNPENSPTITMSPTRAGMILGTAPYMAPEQARGKTVDKRADIWAFGCVLYEMLTGERAFTGETVSDILAAVLKSEPDFSKAPAHVHRLLERCLEKDPKKRLRDIGDVGVLLDKDAQAQAPPAAPPPATSRWLWPAIAAVCALTAAALALVYFRQTPPAAPVVRTAILPPENASLDARTVSVSPDGRRIAFSAESSDGKTQLWIRPLDSLTAQPLAGTDGATYTFWSPDGNSVGFIANGKLNRIDSAGGPVLTLAGVPSGLNGASASWSPKGYIVFNGADRALHKIPASGGPSTIATKLAPDETFHRWPSFLPDGVHFLFMASAKGPRKRIRLGSLDSSGSVVLLEADSNAIYSSGYLLFAFGESTLMARPFDLQHLALSGDARPVAEGLGVGLVTGIATFSASPTGLLAYGSAQYSQNSLTWLDRKGKVLATIGEPGSIQAVTLSPSGKTIAVLKEDNLSLNDWLVDAERGVAQRFTSTGGDQDMIFSPDGTTAFFSSNRNGNFDIYRKPVNMSHGEELVYTGGENIRVNSISPDGKFLLIQRQGRLWVLPNPLGPPGKAKPYRFPGTEFSEDSGQFSPDGRWVAYESNESGRTEIYVAPFPGPGGRRRISAAGGRLPRWRRDGKEIFYIAANQMLTATEVSVNNGVLEAGATHELFAHRYEPSPYFSYDVAADGRILALEAKQDGRRGLTIVQNWAGGLQK